MRLVPQQRLLPGFLQLAEQANPEGTIYVITGNLSSHDSKSTRAWLEDHPRIPNAFVPKGACWLNMQEGWWRIFRRQALVGRSFADPDEIAHATRVATAQLNARARPWIWARRPSSADARHLRRPGRPPSATAPRPGQLKSWRSKGPVITAICPAAISGPRRAA